MPWIGIDKDLGFYEGAFAHGHAVLPTPITAPAMMIAEEKFPPKLPPSYAIQQVDLLFREDSFDAVTRVRRGRFYLASPTRPDNWEVHPHPSRPSEAREAGRHGTITRRLYSFQPLPTPSFIKETHHSGQPLIVIGVDSSFTIWTISSVEGTASGEYVVTLRGRQTFGVLPELVIDAIPMNCRQAIQDTVMRLRDDIFRAGPSSIIDRARDVASAALSGYLQDLGAIGAGKDLNELIKKLNTLEDPKRKRLAAAAAEITRLLHSRAKPSVREKLPVSPVREQEAELAAYCAGCILRELGWAEWPI